MDNSNGKPTLLTMAEVVAYLHLSRATILNHVKSGRLKCMKPGKVYRFRLADIEAFLDSSLVAREDVPCGQEVSEDDTGR